MGEREAGKEGRRKEGGREGEREKGEGEEKREGKGEGLSNG